jgi:hypothetical protein
MSRLVGLLLLGLFVAAPEARAALTVSPMRVVLHGKPRAALVSYFTVENTGDARLEIEVEPEDWSRGVQGDRGAVEWLTVHPKRVNLKPGQRARVKCTVRVPKQASGELRTQVFFSSHVSGAAMPVRSRLGAILYVVVEDTQQLDAAVTDVAASYTASTPGIASPDRFDVAVRIHNRSNVHVAPSGDVELRDQAGIIVARIPLQSGWALLPNEQDAYHAIGHGLYLKPGAYTLAVTVRYGADVRRLTTITSTFTARLTPEGSVEVFASPPASPSL